MLTWTRNLLSLLSPIWLVMEMNTMVINICQRLANTLLVQYVHKWIRRWSIWVGGFKTWKQISLGHLGKTVTTLQHQSFTSVACLSFPHAKIFPCFYECVWLDHPQDEVKLNIVHYLVGQIYTWCSLNFTGHGEKFSSGSHQEEMLACWALYELLYLIRFVLSCPCVCSSLNEQCI